MARVIATHYSADTPREGRVSDLLSAIFHALAGPALLIGLNAGVVALGFEAPAARPSFPAHDEVADPEAGWATRNPSRALAFLFVSPRDCGALDELMAL